MANSDLHGVYGTPPPDLADIPAGAIQFSPLIPGAEQLAERQGALASLAMLAPPGKVDRRHDLALALRALRVGGELVVLAPKDKGGARLAGELSDFGLVVAELSKRHHRICHAVRPEALEGIDEAVAAGAPRLIEDLGLWSQPGVFAFDRVDPGSALLLAHLRPLSGRGADFGCGIGILAHAVLASTEVSELTLIDLDRRAIDCARRNVADPRARFLWADLRKPDTAPSGLDFVVMNPPFHDGGTEDRALGQLFIERAAQSLRKGGMLHLTANRHLPYEAPLERLFARVRLVVSEQGYKIYEAQK
jgi:16S rRNA (guanine1207-N2)-methyltransferase